MTCMYFVLHMYSPMAANFKCTLFAIPSFLYIIYAAAQNIAP